MLPTLDDLPLPLTFQTFTGLDCGVGSSLSFTVAERRLIDEGWDIAAIPHRAKQRQL